MFRPRHTFASVAARIADGLDNGTVVLGRRAERFTETERESKEKAVPRMRMSEDHLTMLRDQLARIRKTAFVWLRERYQDLKSDEVRASVFLPDIRKTAHGDVCELWMPEKLRINMSGHSDEQIRFRPYQGVTGLVFVQQRPAYAHSLEQVLTGYSLSEDQSRQINRGLRWIVSFPILLSDQGTRRTLGVLNVDGLNHEVSAEHVHALPGILMTGVASFQQMFADLALSFQGT